MLVHFKKLRWRNVLSTGQMWTEIQLDRSPSTMITGKNGAGKSTMLDAITFVLFGKAFRRINKGQLINTKNNRDLLVEIEFDVGQDVFLVRRGIKPEIFEVFKNGMLQNQPGANRDYQSTLENSFLGFDYQTFTQIVMVGKAQHVSFMKLDSLKRRLFVESILNLLVFSNMNKLHTLKMNRLKDRNVELKAAISVAAEKVSLRKKYIEDLERQARAQEANQHARYHELVGRLSAEIEIEQKELDAVEKVAPIQKSAAAKNKKEIDAHRELEMKFTMKIESMESQMQFLRDNTICQSCDQDIPSDTREHKCTQVQTKIEECRGAKNRIEQELSRLREERHNMETQEELYKAFLSQVSAMETSIAQKKKQIEDLQGTLIYEESTHRENITQERKRLNEFSEIYEQLLIKRAELVEKTEYYNIINMMLKDGGIKSSIIKRYITIINHSINSNLAKLGFFAKFTLDENFDETIQARGIDTMSYNNFSEGEKLRIDMAILLAWRDVAKIQSGVSTNLLVFDEVLDGSLDSIGTDALVSLLAELKDTNIFIVTHSPDKIADKVRSQISFQKVEGFSKLAP